MSHRLLLALALTATVACDKRKAEPPRPAPSAERAPPAAALAQHHGLTWHVDALAPALAEAKRAQKLVLVDLWARWCHTCLSMREYVLTAEHLAGVRERLVFAAIDTERAGNAPVLAKLPIAAWPTFYLVDGDGQVHGRWVGAASPSQLATFVRDGLRSLDAHASGSLEADAPLALLVEGDRLFAAGRLEDAALRYERALAAAPADWPRGPDTRLALAAALHKLGHDERCVALGLAELSHTGQSASATDFAYHVLGCAESLPASDARVARLKSATAARLHTLCTQASPQMTPDDRGDACGLLRQVRSGLGDADGARAATLERLALLTRAAEGVPDAVALTYDFARAESLVQLGRGDEAVALLTARERALPDDYNPPHYLARTYRDLGRHQDGLDAIERALTKVQGPRRAGILGVQVDLLEALGRRDEAKRVLEVQLAAYRALPDAQKQPARERAVAERLAGFREETQRAR